MLAEFRFESPLLRTTLRESAVREVTVEQLDATETIPLRSLCWVDDDRTETFEAGLEADRTVERADQVVETDCAAQYDVRHTEQPPETEMYDIAIEEEGVFISGTRRPDHWEVGMRFPDRAAFATFQDRVALPDLSVQSMRQETSPQTEQYGLSDPQREILRLASEEDYFDVPRQSSLADLADELGVSSQAASERLRRGLDSLVDRALLAPE